MRIRRLEMQEKKLDTLFDKVANINEDEIKSHLAKYLCVQASGYLENVIKELVAEFHDGTCKENTEFFVNDKLKTFTNVDEDKLEKLLKSFNGNWYDSYKDMITEKQLSSLNSIVTQRHLIAHGKESMSNISFPNMVQYYNDLKELVLVLRKIIKKGPATKIIK